MHHNRPFRLHGQRPGILLYSLPLVISAQYYRHGSPTIAIVHMMEISSDSSPFWQQLFVTAIRPRIDQEPIGLKFVLDTTWFSGSDRLEERLTNRVARGSLLHPALDRPYSTTKLILE